MSASCQLPAPAKTHGPLDYSLYVSSSRALFSTSWLQGCAINLFEAHECPFLSKQHAIVIHHHGLFVLVHGVQFKSTTSQSRRSTTIGLAHPKMRLVTQNPLSLSLNRGTLDWNDARTVTTSEAAAGTIYTHSSAGPGQKSSPPRHCQSRKHPSSHASLFNQAQTNAGSSCARYISRLPCARIITDPCYRPLPLHSCGIAYSTMERHRKRRLLHAASLPAANSNQESCVNSMFAPGMATKVNDSTTLTIPPPPPLVLTMQQMSLPSKPRSIRP